MSNPELKKFGTLPVFLTSICTILGAILFLRFGWAIGQVGLLGTIGIVIIGHLVTIPTSLAIAEIATNQRVEGGGAYYIISRSFGLNIGGAIGIALYLSQAISVAFYVIAFAESFRPVLDSLATSGVSLDWMRAATGSWELRWISIPSMALLAALVLTRGANSGMNLLYGVAVILGISLLMFFFGKPVEGFEGTSLTSVLSDAFNPDKLNEANMSAATFKELRQGPAGFFLVFTIIFPAFTGIIAGLGLSGDLRDPSKSIPQGTLWATGVGMIIYILVAIKLAMSAPAEMLVNKDRLIMGDIAMWYWIVPIGLAAAAISSALGSILVAPRTLQALGGDKVLPGNSSDWVAEVREKDKEPINGGMATVVIGFVFVLMGNVDFVAEIISMFFMVTYGAICLISFMEHFSGNPAYRPSFNSRWYLSLAGAILCIWLMFKMKASYAFGSIIVMVGFYLWISRTNKKQDGLVRIFKGVILQTSRSLRVFLQKQAIFSEIEQKEDEKPTGPEANWTPSLVCLSRDSFQRLGSFDMLRFLSYKYGFGTYVHFLEGRYSKQTVSESKAELRRLAGRAKTARSNVYVDTVISPSYTSAIAHALQLPGISGQDNNTFLFEFSPHEEDSLNDLSEHFGMIKADDFDVCVLRSSDKGFGYKRQIHLWLTAQDYENSSLMILLAYIILGHDEWRKGEIKIFAIYPETELETRKERLLALIGAGRLPISPNNISFISRKDDVSIKSVIDKTSSDADLTILGFRKEAFKHDPREVFTGFPSLGNVLFVHTDRPKEIG
ncbi:MAG: amino acid permease [Bacteroidia bacterium]